jgi:phosphoglycerate dehydrogenase-like enzyme
MPKKVSRKSTKATAQKIRLHVEADERRAWATDQVTPEFFAKAARPHRELLKKVDITFGSSQSNFPSALANAEILLGCYYDPSDLPRIAPRLRWLQSTSAGVEKVAPHIRDGVILTNASGVHTPKGGEYGMAAILMLNHRVPHFATSKVAHRWDPAYTTPVAGKTLALLGVGAIGGEVARLAKRFGMNVVGITRSGKPHKSVDRMVKTKDLAKVLPKADVLVSTLPLTPETEGLIGRAQLDLLPRHAGVVNLGRAKVMDYDALRDKLGKGELSGAVLDVYYEEPLPASDSMWDAPNVIMSPHCAVDDAANYVPRCLDVFFRNLKLYLAGKPLTNVVNTKLGY